MEKPMVEVLAERLGHIEHENRLWRWGTLMGLLGLAALALMGQAQPRVADKIEAREFVLRDASGRIRAQLVVWGSGPQGFPALTLGDHTGKARATLGMSPDGGVSLGLWDQAGRPRAELMVAPDGTPMLGLTDRTGKFRARLGSVGVDGSPVLSLMDSAGTLRVGLGMGPGPSLALFDQTGQSRAELGVGVDGNPVVQLRDPAGRLRAAMEVASDGQAHLGLLNQAGRVIWNAP